MKADRMIASLDSATVMFRQLAEFLHGRDAARLLPLPKPVVRWLLIPALSVINRLPERTRSRIACRAGVREGLQPDLVSLINVEAVANHLVSQFPPGRFPAVVIGSSSGALMHIWAALGIPWLPQTLLSLVRRHIEPDDLVSDYAFGQSSVPNFLAANPIAAIYQMNDPANDRFMSQEMAYFRFKYLALPAAYEQFLLNRLEPGGTIIISDCAQSWQVRRASERHTFQVGGFGSTTQDEYYHGGERVRDLLRRHGHSHEKFHVPEPNDTAPESEWGFDQRLLESVTHFARQHGFKVARVRFDTPESPAPFTADLYRWWYRQEGLDARRVFVECFTQMELYWALRTRTVPLWVTFNVRPSLEIARDYLSNSDYSQALLTLFSNTVRSIDLPPVAEWKQALNGSRVVETVGMDVHAFPIDLRSQFNFYFDLQRKIGERHPLPAPLTLTQVKEFAAANSYPGLTWELD